MAGADARAAAPAPVAEPPPGEGPAAELLDAAAAVVGVAAVPRNVTAPYGFAMVVPATPPVVPVV